MLLKWYIKRLGTMSIVEIMYRVRQFLQKKLEKYNIYKVKYDSRICEDLLSQNIFFDGLKLPEDLLAEFSDYDNFNFFTHFNISLNEKIDWHYDLSTGGRFPMIFSKDIDIRSGRYGSAKVVWEVNRLQFLIPLLLRYKCTGDNRYLDRFVYYVEDWKRNNPYLVGVNWYSNIEVNIRLIVWYYCWKIIFSDRSIIENSFFVKFVKDSWIPSIYEHCIYSYRNPSKFSSSNNHLIAEYSGLYVASALWKFDESTKWNQYAKRGLETEIQRQFSINGINKEEAAEYIQFIVDFFVIPFAVSCENKIDKFSKEYVKKLNSIIEYIYNLLDKGGSYRKYGDEDDGKVLITSSNSEFNNFKSILTSGAILDCNSNYKSNDNGFDIKNLLLFGYGGYIKYSQIKKEHSDRNSCFYQKDGHFIFRKEVGKKETYLHFDAAPLGFLSIAAHGHADALSIALHVNGQPVLVDIGTYTYHTEEMWRRYFVSTLGHNTVCIDGKDQADLTGPTMWHNHYHCKVLEVFQNEKFERVRASHTGYSRLKTDIIREVEFDRIENTFTIVDTIDILGGERKILIPWHFHPNIELLFTDTYTAKVKLNGKEIAMISFDSGLDIGKFKGSINPILGWYSPSFMVKEETLTILQKRVSSGTNLFKTKIKIIE
jgi:hypothetical protein